MLASRDISVLYMIYDNQTKYYDDDDNRIEFVTGLFLDWRDDEWRNHTNTYFIHSVTHNFPNINCKP